MKICVITTSFPRFKGDYSGLFVFRLCQALASLNLKMDVVAPADNTSVAEEVMGRCRVQRFSYFFPKSLQKLAYGPGGLPARLKRNPLYFLFVPLFIAMFLIKTLRVSKNADLIHAQWLYSGVIAAIVKKVRGTPVVLTLRGSDVRLAQKRKTLAVIAHWVIAHASFITTVNQEMKHWVIQQGVSAEAVAVIRNGVDLNGGHETRGPAEICRFIFVGNLVSGKGIRVLIEALALLRETEQNFHLNVVGDGEELNHLKSRVDERNLRDFVAFSGMKPAEQIPALMRASDCLVLPSFSEGIPNVVLEAMASGLPVVASDLPGIREVVQDGESGFLTAPGKVKPLAEKLMEMIQSPERRQKMGQNAYQRMIDLNLSWEQSARQYLEVYQKVCAASQASST